MKSKKRKKPSPPIEHVIQINFSKKTGLEVVPPAANVRCEFPIAWDYTGPGAVTLVFAPRGDVEVIRAVADKTGPAIAIPHRPGVEAYAVVRLPDRQSRRQRSRQGGGPKDVPDHVVTAVLIVMERGEGA